MVIVKLDINFPFEQYLHWFSPTSTDKINSYKFRIDQMRSFVSELLKYYYLAKLLSVPVASINIKHTNLGKPVLIGLLEHVSFSISHSGEYVVMATSLDKNIGVDIEEIENKIDKL